MEKKKIGVRDLVNTGIFTVLNFVLFFVMAFTGFVPVMAVFFTVLLAFAAGIPNILFFTKIDKFGLVTIMGTLLGLINFLSGYGPYPLIAGIGCGLISDLVMKAGKYKSWKTMLLGYVIFSEWAMGTQLPMFMMGQSYAEMYRESQGDNFANTLAALIQGYMVPVVIASIAVAAVFGAYLGRAVLNKHFRRAGVV
ncbi:MAG: MptD family putative ECF transporter S component [Lachnospiraceae bacterium]